MIYLINAAKSCNNIQTLAQIGGHYEVAVNVIKLYKMPTPTHQDHTTQSLHNNFRVIKAWGGAIINVSKVLS